MSRLVSVLIVDDSPLVCSILKRGLEQFNDILIVGTAHDPYEARDIITNRKPDVITLDIEMPRMNGVEFLKHLMSQIPIPVVMVSSLSERGKQITFDALSYGAIDFVTKPQGNDPNSVSSLIIDLYNKIKSASMVKVKQLTSIENHQGRYSLDNAPKRNLTFRKNTIVAIGASTGGTEALKEIIPKLPAHFPPILIAQHMPKGFTSMFAQRLNTHSEITVKEACDKDIVQSGVVYIAPGGVHMGIKKDGGKDLIELSESAIVNGHRPSVEYLFKSIDSAAVDNKIAVILTGMGRDGSHAMLSLHQHGVYTIAQDEKTSVVFGMPGEAIKLGAASSVLPLDRIADTLIEQTKE